MRIKNCQFFANSFYKTTEKNCVAAKSWKTYSKIIRSVFREMFENERKGLDFLIGAFSLARNIAAIVGRGYGKGKKRDWPRLRSQEKKVFSSLSAVAAAFSVPRTRSGGRIGICLLCTFPCLNWFPLFRHFYFSFLGTKWRKPWENISLLSRFF